MRQEKEKFAPEKRLLEHLREKRERKEQGYPPPYCPYNNPQTCQLCHTLRDADVFGDKEERRIVEIDTINELFDDLIEHRNAQMIGHTVSLVSCKKILYKKVNYYYSYSNVTAE